MSDNEIKPWMREAIAEILAGEGCCPICGWRLGKDGIGCSIGDCSYRPGDDRGGESKGIEARRKRFDEGCEIIAKHAPSVPERAAPQQITSEQLEKLYGQSQTCFDPRYNLFWQNFTAAVNKFFAEMPERAAMPEKPTRIQAFWDAQAEWSRATFGSDSEPLKHLAKEAVEAQVIPADPVEIADCLFLVFDAARRAGMTLDTLIKVAEQKLTVNKARKWQKPADGEAFAEHVREASHDSVVSPEKPEKFIEACPACKSTSLDRERWCMAYHWTPHRVGVHLSGCVLCNHPWHDSVGEDPREQESEVMRSEGIPRRNSADSPKECAVTGAAHPNTTQAGEAGQVGEGTPEQSHGTGWGDYWASLDKDSQQKLTESGIENARAWFTIGAVWGKRSPSPSSLKEAWVAGRDAARQIVDRELGDGPQHASMIGQKIGALQYPVPNLESKEATEE